MVEVFFNEVSVLPYCTSDEEVKERISSYVQLLEFCGTLGFKKVRYEKSVEEVLLKENYSLKEYIGANKCDNSVRLILSMFRKPYLDDDSQAEEKYINTSVKLKKGEQILDAEGLTCAYLVDGFSIGFASEDFWTNNISFVLNVLDQKSNKTLSKRVFCISNLDQFNKDEFIQWIIQKNSVSFKSCDIPFEKKRISLRDDHGKDKLEKFATRLLREDFVVEVVNSLPFQPYATNMIGSIRDGLIDIILTDSDKGYGMVIKTTAQSSMLTNYMASYIKQKYK